jgi:hypothetical protein
MQAKAEAKGQLHIVVNALATTIYGMVDQFTTLSIDVNRIAEIVANLWQKLTYDDHAPLRGRIVDRLARTQILIL